MNIIVIIVIVICCLIILSLFCSFIQNMYQYPYQQQPTNQCQRTGCGGFLCADRPTPGTCEWRCEYDCYDNATCMNVNGECQWVFNDEGLKCLEECKK